MFGARRLTTQTLARPQQSATLTGTAVISTDQSRFGTKSLFLPGGTGNSARFNLASPDFFGGNGTVEFWFRTPGTGYPTSYNVLFTVAGAYFQNIHSILLRNNNSIIARTKVGTTFTEGAQQYFSITTWNHYAITVENDLYLTAWLNGNRLYSIGNGINTLTTASGSFWVLGNGNPNIYFNEFRASQSIRYDRANATYTVPTAKFVNDSDTKMLFHFDGTDETTAIYDDVDWV